MDKGLAKIWAVVIIFLVIVLSAGLGVILGTYYPQSGLFGAVKDVWRPPFGGQKLVRILVIGEDNTGGNKEKPRGLSDTIMLVSLDLEANRVTALSVPRDTMVEIPGHGTVKINAAHVIGGVPLVSQMVEEITGVHPDYYMKTDSEGFKKCVDILGGVEIDVEKNMHYDDNWGHLHINLKKGRQVLSGVDAMGYVRFRHDAMGDITRVERQRKFLMALAKKTLEPGSLPKLPKIVAELNKHVETNLSPKDLLALAKLPEKIDLSTVKTETLPGAPQNIGGASYWIADPERMRELINELFFSRVLPGLPTVEVLNGSGVSGTAGRVAEALRSRGYEVKGVGNADSFDYETSRVVCHRSDLAGVESITDLLGVPVSEELSEGGADVTVIVGKDALQ
ncbi:MAG: LCP family protein [Armatimonadota bacterium]